MQPNNSSSNGQLTADRLNDKYGKLPCKTLTIHPSPELRVRILEIKRKHRMTAAQVAERLLATAADVKIPWLVIKPQNGSEAGVSLRLVEGMLIKTYNVLSGAVGVCYRADANEQARRLEQIRDGALELWCAAQKLAKETFFDPEEFGQMCDCHQFVRESCDALKKQLDEEKRKEKPDLAKIAIYAKRIAGYETTQHVLKRLGCEVHDAL